MTALEPATEEQVIEQAVHLEAATSPQDIDSNTLQTIPQLQSTFANAEPGEVLLGFLDALQNNNMKVAENLLTDVARYETKRAQMQVNPIPAAKYQVGQTRFATQQKNVAHVESLWTGFQSGGKTTAFEITWVLRKVENSWRVSGMLTAPAPNEPQIFLNFENPVEMVARVEQVEAGDAANGKVQPASFEQPIK
jgi:hypothetical protein